MDSVNHDRNSEQDEGAGFCSYDLYIPLVLRNCNESLYALFAIKTVNSGVSWRRNPRMESLSSNSFFSAEGSIEPTQRRSSER